MDALPISASPSDRSRSAALLDAAGEGPVVSEIDVETPSIAVL